MFKVNHTEKEKYNRQLDSEMAERLKIKLWTRFAMHYFIQHLGLQLRAPRNECGRRNMLRLTRTFICLWLGPCPGQSQTRVCGRLSVSATHWATRHGTKSHHPAFTYPQISTHPCTLCSFVIPHSAFEEWPTWASLNLYRTNRRVFCKVKVHLCCLASFTLTFLLLNDVNLIIFLNTQLFKVLTKK